MRRVIAVLMTCCMCVSLCQAELFAGQDSTQGKLPQESAGINSGEHTSTEDNVTEHAQEIPETATESSEAAPKENTEILNTEEPSETAMPETQTEETKATESVSETSESELLSDTELPANTEELQKKEVSKKDGAKPGASYEDALAIGLGIQVTATPGLTSTEHWYRFTLQQAGMISLSFEQTATSGAAGNLSAPAWGIYSDADRTGTGSAYELMSSVFGTANKTAEMGLSAGTYRIKITGMSQLSTASYRIKVDYRAADCETEDNNRIETADALSLGTMLEGSLYKANDADYYRIATPANGCITVTLYHEAAEDKKGQNIYHLTLCDTSGKALHDWYSQGQETSRVSIRMWEPKGEYLIKVDHPAISNYESGNYRIIAYHTAVENWEKEVNDTADMANEVESGVTYGGTLASVTDVDYFTISGTQNGYLSLYFGHDVVSGYEKDDIFQLTIYKKGDKNQLTEVYSEKNKGGTTGLVTANIGLTAGTYYIKVNGLAQILPTIQSKALAYPADYHITVQWNNAVNWETESNNTMAAANQIKSQTTYYGSTFCADDVDYFKIDQNKAGYLQLNLKHENTQSTDSHYVLELYNTDGTRLFQVNNTGTETNYTTPKIGLAKGTYYVCLRAGSQLCTGDYSLKAITKADSNWESETNGDLSTADKLTLGKETHGVVTDYSTDLDYYTFTSDKSTYMNFSRTHDKINADTTSWYVYLLRADGKRYTIYKGTDHLYSSAGASYTESSPLTLPGGTYYLVVRAYHQNAIGKEYTVSANRLGAKKPSITSVTSRSYNQLKLMWKSVPGAESYTIYRSDRKDGTYSEVKTICNVSNTSWTDAKLTTGKTYYYKMKATVATRGGSKTGSCSAVKSGKAVPSKTTVKASPGKAKICLSWKQVSGASGYEIYRCTSGNGTYRKIKTITKGSAKKYTDGKVSAGNTCYYKIRAYRTVNKKKVYGGYSKVISSVAK